MMLKIFKVGFYLVTRIQKSTFLKIKHYYFELFYIGVEEVDTFDFVNGSKKEKI